VSVKPGGNKKRRKGNKWRGDVISLVKVGEAVREKGYQKKNWDGGAKGMGVHSPSSERTEETQITATSLKKGETDPNWLVVLQKEV